MNLLCRELPASARWTLEVATGAMAAVVGWMTALAVYAGVPVLDRPPGTRTVFDALHDGDIPGWFSVAALLVATVVGPWLAWASHHLPDKFDRWWSARLQAFITRHSER